MKHLIEKLYSSEINLQFSWFWDAGFDIKIGDDWNGFVAEFNSDDLDECEKWIEEKVKEHFPNSKFAKTYTGETFESAVDPAIRYLFKNYNPNSKIHINYATAELLIGEKSHNLNDEVPD